MPKVITSTLSVVAAGTGNGVDIQVGTFFRNARRSGLWPHAEAIHRRALSNARKKVPWDVFRDTRHEAVQVAYALWPDKPQDTWHGMSVVATDGSKYLLPATEELRQEFDPHSGLETPGKGHYPQCLVSTLYDVFRRRPIARTIESVNGSEREEAAKLLPAVPKQSVWLFDRGDPSYDLFRLLIRKFDGYFIFRCSASCTFPAVEAFVKSGQPEGRIWLTPSNQALERCRPRQRKHLKALHLRIILLESPDGTVSVLLTNLLNPVAFPRQELITLYFRRWTLEDYYRDEKVTLDIEQFHSRTPNGIRQEFFAAMIMTVISRTLMIGAAEQFLSDDREGQFKNTIRTLASEAALFVPADPAQALAIFREVLKEMARVQYYRPNIPRPPQPRINKHPVNTWSKRNRQTAT